MKKNLWIWALAALSMAACTSEDAPTPEQVVTENDWISPDGQVVVQLSAEGLPTPNVSVGRAAIEGTDIINLDNLGIFALSRGGDNKSFEEVDYFGQKAEDEYLPYEQITNNDNEVLLNNILAKGAATTTLDATLHDNLKRIRLYADEAAVESGTASIYYYPLQPKDNYNFYGYFPRQKTSSKVLYGKNTVKVEFEPTQGDTDIITGKQEENAPTMSAGMLYVDENDFTQTNQTAWDGYNARYIRNIKYHNWLIDEKNFNGTSKPKQKFVPAIKFKHRTAFLEFFIVANENQSGATPDEDTPDEDEPYIDQEKTKQLRVFNLHLVKENKVATWNVVTDELTWDNQENMDMVKLELDDLNTARRKTEYNNGSDFTEEQYNEIWGTETIEEVETDVMIPAAKKEEAKPAGYLLVQPKDSYQVELSILAPANSGSSVPPIQTTTLDIKLSGDQSFKEGYRYKVYIKLNALQEVNIHAELEDWQNGDDVDVPVE